VFSFAICRQQQPQKLQGRGRLHFPFFFLSFWGWNLLRPLLLLVSESARLIAAVATIASIAANLLLSSHPSSLNRRSSANKCNFGCWLGKGHGAGGERKELGEMGRWLQRWRQQANA